MTNGEGLINTKKDTLLEIIDKLKEDNTPRNITEEEKESEVDVEIKKEDINSCVKYLKTLE